MVKANVKFLYIFKIFSSLSDEMLKIENKTIESIIKYYCRESGVRNLQKHLEKVFNIDNNLY